MSDKEKFLSNARGRREQVGYDLAACDSEKPLQEPFVQGVMAAVEGGGDGLSTIPAMHDRDWLDTIGAPIAQGDPVEILVSAVPESAVVDNSEIEDLLAPSHGDPLDELFAPETQAAPVCGDATDSGAPLSAAETDMTASLLEASTDDPVGALLGGAEPDWDGDDLLAQSDTDPLDILLGGSDEDSVS